MNRNLETKEWAAANSTCKKLAVQCSPDSVMIKESVMLPMNICGKYRHLQAAAKRNEKLFL